MRVLVIEDEPLAARDLVHSLRTVRPEIAIVGILHSVRESKEWMSKNIPFDLLVTDIELGDGNCFEIFQDHPVHAPVIFTTAYDHFALEAFRHNGISYLLKPYGLPAVEEALSKAERLVGSHQADFETMQRVIREWQPRPRPRTLLIRAGDRLIPLSTDSIALLVLENGKVWIRTFDGSELPMDQTLEEFEKAMSPTDFFRLNRQAIVHRKAIREALQRLDRKLEIGLVSPLPTNQMVSREKAPAFLEWLSTQG